MPHMRFALLIALTLAACSTTPQPTASEAAPTVQGITDGQAQPKTTQTDKSKNQGPRRTAKHKSSIKTPTTIVCTNGTKFILSFTQDNIAALVKFTDTGLMHILHDNEVASGIEYGNDKWTYKEYAHKMALTNNETGSETSCRAAKKKKK